MNSTQNPVKNVSSFAVSSETVKIVEAARKMADQNNKIFVAAHFKQILEVFNVCVKIPAATAKYMKSVPQHEIAVLNDSLSSLNILKVPAHFVHGDFLRREESGKVKPSVIRHFMVNEEDLGKDVPCTVVIKEKNDLLTGEKTIIIDVLSQVGKSICDKTLRLGVPALGIKNEVCIPDTNLCIRIEKSETRTMERCKQVIEAPLIPAEPIAEEKPKLQLKKVVKVSSEIAPEVAPVFKPKLKLNKRVDSYKQR